ncbi:MAG: hypothetical protein HVN35_03125 [Methanobacteriaceae archaeon]|nr:hypothetical protein [Methanobacteriaceae archaeon]
MAKNSYSRKISKKEAESNFISILKNNLAFFPPLGENFVLNENNSSHEVKVESYPCTCRGPDLPHEHYFITWEGLKPGNRVEIIKNPSKNSEYDLKIFF